MSDWVKTQNGWSQTGGNGVGRDEFDNLKKEIPTKLSDLESDSTHRTVTDEQIETWNEGGSSESDLFGTKAEFDRIKDDPSIPVGAAFDTTDESDEGIAVIDNLISTSTEDALSANQGRVLKQDLNNKENQIKAFTSMADYEAHASEVKEGEYFTIDDYGNYGSWNYIGELNNSVSSLSCTLDNYKEFLFVAGYLSGGARTSRLTSVFPRQYLNGTDRVSLECGYIANERTYVNLGYTSTTISKISFNGTYVNSVMVYAR